MQNIRGTGKIKTEGFDAGKNQNNSVGEGIRMKKSPVKTIAAVVIGTLLFFVLGSYAAIPTPLPDIYISFQYGVLAFLAALFGPIAGCAAGVLGHILLDYTSMDMYWIWITASGIFGFFAGLSSFKMRLDEGKFKYEDGLYFNVWQIMGSLIAWSIFMPIAEALVNHKDYWYVLQEGMLGGSANIITTILLGTVLCAAYAAIRRKKR